MGGCRLGGSGRGAGRFSKVDGLEQLERSSASGRSLSGWMRISNGAGSYASVVQLSLTGYARVAWQTLQHSCRSTHNRKCYSAVSAEASSESQAVSYGFSQL